MGHYAKILGDVNRTIKLYGKKKYILNPRFSERNQEHNTISSKSETDTRNPNYLTVYNSCRDNDEYIFELFDNSLVQMYYRFGELDGEITVTNCSLVYYPSPYSKILSEDEPCSRKFYDDPALLRHVLDTVSSFKMNSNYLRIDYNNDSENYTKIVHTRGHIHIGFDNKFRLPINRIPLLSEFMDFIFFLYYTEKWKTLHANCNPEDECTDEIISQISSSIMGDKSELTNYDLLDENEKLNYRILI